MILHLIELFLGRAEPASMKKVEGLNEVEATMAKSIRPTIAESIAIFVLVAKMNGTVADILRREAFPLDDSMIGTLVREDFGAGVQEELEVMVVEGTVVVATRDGCMQGILKIGATTDYMVDHNCSLYRSFR